MYNFNVGFFVSREWTSSSNSRLYSFRSHQTPLKQLDKTKVTRRLKLMVMAAKVTLIASDFSV